MVVVDCPSGAPGPAMQIAGMTVLERILRDHHRRGHDSAIVRCAAADLPDLPDLPMAVRITGHDEPAPAGAAHARADEYLGVPITGESSRTAVEWAFMQTCRAPDDGPGRRLLVRNLSLRLSRLLSRVPTATAVTVSYAALALGLLAVVLLAIGARWATVLGGFTLLLQLVATASAEEIATLRHDRSPLGPWLRSAGSDAVDGLVIAALGVGAGGAWATIAFIAALGFGGAATVAHRAALSQGRPGDTSDFSWWFEANAPQDLITWVRFTHRRDSYLLIFATACALSLSSLALFLAVVLGLTLGGLAVAHQLLRSTDR